MTPAGEVVAFSHSLPEDAPGARFSPDEARSLAQRYLTEDRGWSLSDWEAVTASTEDRAGGRIDHHFEWKRRSWGVGESELRLAVDVQGNRVDGYGYWLKVPATANHFYGLSTQVPATVYVATTKTKRPTEIRGVEYRFVTLKPSRFFGYQKARVYTAEVMIAEPEKAVVDSLDKMSYAGGIAEVARVVHVVRQRVDLSVTTLTMSN